MDSTDTSVPADIVDANPTVLPDSHVVSGSSGSFFSSFSGFGAKVKNMWEKAAPVIEQYGEKQEAQTKKLGTSIVHMAKNTFTLDPLTESEELGIYYITRRLLIMDYPDRKDTHNVSMLEKSADYLNANHGSGYMVYNLSERTYDVSFFNYQVLDTSFPGYPVPPLEKLFEQLQSMYGWLRADKQNIAVVHGLNGYGRSALVVAVFMAWVGYQEENPRACIEGIASHLRVPLIEMQIPSQARYLNYSSALLRGRYPSVAPLQLERVVMLGIPNFENDGFRPYLQIYSQSKLIYSSAGNEGEFLQWYNQESGAVVFPVNLSLQGNFLIRIRHLASNGQRISLFRCVLHTGYITPGSLRLTMRDLDGGSIEKYGDITLDIPFRELNSIQNDTDVISDGAAKTAEISLMNDLGDVIQVSDKLEEKQNTSDKFWKRIIEMHKERKLKKQQLLAQQQQDLVTPDVDIEDAKKFALSKAQGGLVSNSRKTPVKHPRSKQHDSLLGDGSDDNDEAIETNNVLYNDDVLDVNDADDDLAEIEGFLKSLGVSTEGADGILLANPSTLTNEPSYMPQQASPTHTTAQKDGHPTLHSPISLHGVGNQEQQPQATPQVPVPTSSLNFHNFDSDSDSDAGHLTFGNPMTRSNSANQKQPELTAEFDLDSLMAELPSPTLEEKQNTAELDLDALMADLQVQPTSKTADVDINALLNELP